MSIMFTGAIITRLQLEIADLESKSATAKKKQEKAESKINQLQRDVKLSNTHSDLNNKLARINKLNVEIKTTKRLLADIAKQLTAKKASLKQYIEKDSKHKN